MPHSILTPVWISLKTATIATIITFCLGLAIAYGMNSYRGKFKGFIETILTAPLVLPPTVVGFLLLLLLGKNGFLGRWLQGIGIQIVFTWYATVIAATVVAFPLMYQSASTALAQIDRHLMDCAKTLGASKITIFWRIVLPLAKPGLITGTLLTFARALGEFGATLMLAGSIPGKTQTIPIAIYLTAASGEMDRALELVIILLLISLGTILAIAHLERGNIKVRHTKYRGYRIAKASDPGEICLRVNIQKQLPDLLLDINFKLDRLQNPLGVLGVSGAGKTTLLRCLAGLAKPDRGVIILNDRILFDSTRGIDLPPQEREIGIIWQDYALFPHLTVAENIAFGIDRRLQRSQIKLEVTRQLEQLELTDLAHRLPEKLSGGEQQRVALARALASKPQLTLLDEPLSALDTNLKGKLLQLLDRRLRSYRGLALYITHNLSEAYFLCPQLLAIEDGLAIAFDNRQTVFNRPPNLKTARLIDCKNISAIEAISPKVLRAIAWGCVLEVPLLVADVTHVGIHAHQIDFPTDNRGVNTFSAWLVADRQSSDRVMLDLSLDSNLERSPENHITAQVTETKWLQLKQQPQPWRIQLPPQHIITFND